MSEYTPATSAVRAGYAQAYYADHKDHRGVAEFDRWLASVKAEAWDEGVRAAFNESIERDAWVPYELKNPHREES